MQKAALSLAVLITACSGERPLQTTERPDRPTRIVSLDFCADQYVLKLADRENILALSPEAVMAHSYMRTKAEGMPSVRPLAEDAIALQPDLGWSHIKTALLWWTLAAICAGAAHWAAGDSKSMSAFIFLGLLGTGCMLWIMHRLRAPSDLKLTS